MSWEKMSIGSKNPKKEITIDVKPKHYVYFFLFLMGVVFMVYAALINFGFYEVEEIKISCTDGTEEVIISNKVIYCGEHYNILKDKVSARTFQDMEMIIKNE